MSIVSVVVPIYNVEQYLYRCVDSILNQTFTDFEMILVDDGSPDNCGRICDEYANKDKRIHVIHQENGGLSAARNAGIDYVFANSTSEWITFVDSDDWIHPQMLETLYYANIQNNTNVSICGFEKVYTDFIEIENKNIDITLFNSEDFYTKHNINATVAWGKLYKKDCFKELRYPVGKLHEDEFVTYKVLFSYNYISIIKEPLYFYFYNANSIINTWSKNRLSVFDALEEQIEFFKKNNYKNIAVYRINAYFNLVDKYCKLIKKNDIKNKVIIYFILIKKARHIIKKI